MVCNIAASSLHVLEQAMHFCSFAVHTSSGPAQRLAKETVPGRSKEEGSDSEDEHVWANEGQPKSSKGPISNIDSAWGTDDPQVGPLGGFTSIRGA